MSVAFVNEPSGLRSSPVRERVTIRGIQGTAIRNYEKLSYALLNVSFEADWQYIRERKQHRILQNNKKENAKRNDHTYHPGDEVMVREDPHRKLEGARFSGPYTVTQVNDNGTVQLSKATRRGAVLQTWNIRNVKPC